MTSPAMLSLIIGLLVGAVAAALTTRALIRARQIGTQADVRAEQATAAAETRADTERARADAARARSEAAEARSEAAQSRAETSAALREVAELKQHDAEAQTLVSRAQAETARVNASLVGMRAERDAALDQVAQLQDDTARMSNQFTVLAGQSLEQQGKLADAAHAERLKATEALIAPLTQQIGQLQERLVASEKDRASISAELRQQVQSVLLTGESLRRETAALSTALRKPQVRGSWGELQLRRAVEMAGMIEHCDFIEQATTVNSDDATIRPDLKVMFGEGKFIYVDSKVPLSSFLDAQEADSDADRAKHLSAFGANVRTHIDQLSAKHYWKADPGSLDFVVLFMPAEALYAEALTLMPELSQYASDHHIVLATPSTLIGMLRTVAYSWRQAALADSAGQVFSLARELHSRLATMGGHVDKLGRQLSASVKSYNETIGALEGRVLPTARKFRDLKVTENELDALQGIDQQVRSLSSPELLEDAAGLPSLAGHERRSPELPLLGRTEPSSEALVDSVQPRPRAAERRQLG